MAVWIELQSISIHRELGDCPSGGQQQGWKQEQDSAAKGGQCFTLAASYGDDTR